MSSTNDHLEDGPGAVAAKAVADAMEFVSMLLVTESTLSDAYKAAEALARLLADVPDLILRQQTYIERLEGAESALHVQFGEEQRERELLVEQGAVMFAAFTEWFEKIDRLRGRGTPRAVPRTATDNTPRFVAVRRD